MQIQGIEIPPWYLIAQDDIGVRERRGRRHHPRIIEYHETTRLPPAYHRDEVPWCSSAVNCWIEEAGWNGTDSAAAISWVKWGAAAPAVLGAIVVIRRRIVGLDPDTGSRSGNHVGLLAGSDKNFIRLLGGNQRNGVRFSSYPLRRYDVLGYRMPEDYL